MTNSLYIKDKTALITGANRGIGKAILESFLKEGAKKVYAGVRTLTTAQPLIEKFGDKVEVIHIDLENPETISAARETANDVEVVVNNAGVLKNATPLDAHGIDTLKYEMDVNVVGLIRMAQAFSPVLKNNGGGAFVQINSVASMKNFAPFTTYSASKAAAYSVTQGLRDILSDQQGTLVVSVHPGPIATDMAENAGLSEIAEPPELVGDAIIAALKNGEFHVFPDTMAKKIGEAYRNYASDIIEANIMEG